MTVACLISIYFVKIYLLLISFQLTIAFASHGRSFHLRLKRDTQTISPYVKVEVPPRLEGLDFNHLYEGTVEGSLTYESFTWNTFKCFSAVVSEEISLFFQPLSLY